MIPPFLSPNEIAIIGKWNSQIIQAGNQIAPGVVATLKNTTVLKLNMLQFKTFIIRLVLN